MPTVELDAIELWVADLDRLRDQLTATFGFHAAKAPTHARAGSGDNHRAVGLINGGVRLIGRQGTHPGSSVARHVSEHGDTVADVTLRCHDPDAVIERALVRGLNVFGTPAAPKIDVCGDRTLCHTVLAQPLPLDVAPPDRGPQMSGIDHLAYCVPWGSADRIAGIYHDVFGLPRIEAGSFDAVGGSESGMRSVVLGGGGLTVVITEPLSENSTGQTQQFLDAHRGPGVQHAAIAYPDLPVAVESLRKRGVDFLSIPALYYHQARVRLPNPAIPWSVLQRLGILVDADHHGLLFQLFAQPLTHRGPFFFEFIQRAGATGFGANNVRALFDAVQASLAGNTQVASRPGA